MVNDEGNTHYALNRVVRTLALSEGQAQVLRSELSEVLT